jgi:hypothetical protein
MSLLVPAQEYAGKFLEMFKRLPAAAEAGQFQSR